MDHEKYLTTTFRNAKLQRDWRALERRAILGLTMLGSTLTLYAVLFITVATNMGWYTPMH